jgi:tetraacyldisaccharide 4'-kinase
MVLLLTRLLIKRGYAVRILSRGYKRLSKGVERVDPEGEASWFGDEPMVLAQRTGAPVFVGADRYEAGMLAAKEIPGEKMAVYVLDDGFQHWGLGRDVDVALLTADDLEEPLLPAGNLRESLGALKDADVIVLREEEMGATAELVAGLKRGPRAPLVWVIRRRLSFIFREDGYAANIPVKPVVFCGVARPEGFLSMLKAKGVVAADTILFADHHVYEDGDVERLIATAKACGADGFCTTEKDAVKLTPMMRVRMESAAPVVEARLELELLDEKAAMDAMISRVKMMDRRKRRKVWR